MPEELGLPKYWKLSETEPGTMLVEKGEYLGEIMGKFGAQHRFRQVDDGQEVVVGGGSLNWRVEQGHINKGEVFNIIFEGKEKLEKGPYKGKESNNFKIEKFSGKELEEIGFEPTATVAAATEPATASSEGQPLDDLE